MSAKEIGLPRLCSIRHAHTMTARCSRAAEATPPVPNYNVDVDRLSLILLATDTRGCPRNRPPQGHTRTPPIRPSLSPSVLVENTHSLELNKLSASERYARKLDMSDKNAGGCCRQVRGHHAVNTRHTHTTISLHLRHKFQGKSTQQSRIETPNTQQKTQAVKNGCAARSAPATEHLQSRSRGEVRALA